MPTGHHRRRFACASVDEDSARKSACGLDVGGGARRIPKLRASGSRALGGVVPSAEGIREARGADGGAAAAGPPRTHSTARSEHEHALEALARLQCEASWRCCRRREQVQGAADLPCYACRRRVLVGRRSPAARPSTSGDESSARQPVRQSSLRMPIETPLARLVGRGLTLLLR